MPAALVSRQTIGTRFLLLTFDITHFRGVKFDIGDHIGIYPKNAPEEVAKIMDKMSEYNLVVLESMIKWAA